MAEFLRYPREVWLNDLSPQEASSKGLTDKYNRRIREGDITVVKPDEFPWSESEIPHVIKRPDLNYEDVERLIQQDCERYVICKPALTDFISDEDRQLLSKSAQDSLLASKISAISGIKRKNNTSKQDTTVNLNDELLVKTREDDDYTVQIDDYDFELTMTDLSKITIPHRIKKVKKAYRRYKITKAGEIYDKVTDEEVYSKE